MNALIRMTSLAAALVLTATPALAAVTPVQPNQQATGTVRIVKPLTLEWVQDLDLGTVTLTGSTATTVGITKAGVFSCPTGNVTCSNVPAAPHVARYKITGVNNQSVTVNSGNVSLVNQSDNTKTLLLTVDAPASVNLGNSGNSGTNFDIGGNVTVDGTTTDGTYVGTFAVTVNY